MTDEEARRIRQLPEFEALLKARRAVNLPVNLIIIGAYFSFVLTIAFWPQSLGQPAGDGVISIGIYLGLGLLLLAFLLTAIYMRLADGKIAVLRQKLLDKIRQ